MSLALKYRPRTFEQVRGNEEIVEVLVKMLGDRLRAPHAYLFYGPSGCGKTTLGRIVAKTLGCADDDYTEVDSADFRGIDTVREIRKKAQYCAMSGEIRVWLIDECHKMTNDAQNALLKILEDTPGHVYFVLCTTEPQKLLDTIRGRCSQFQVRALDDLQLKGLLRMVVREEGQTLAKEVYEQIIRDSLGQPRLALQILEQVLAASPEKRIEVARRTAEQQSQSIELCRAVLRKAPWKDVALILKGLKDQEAEGVRRVVLGYCQAILLSGKADLRVGYVMECFMEPNFTNGYPQLVFSAFKAVQD
jgi:DNA polymerase-3 subunit gamma/tau